jgi:hypothetical protein
VTQQELEHVVALPQDVFAGVLAASDQVSQRLLGSSRHADRGELACAKQARQLLGVPPVGLDAIPDAHRDEARGHDVAGDAHRGELPVDLIAAAARLVASSHLAFLLEPREQLADLRRVVGDGHHRPAVRPDALENRHGDRLLVHIQTHPKRRRFHSTGSSHAALAAAPPKLTRDYLRASRSLHTV